MVKVIKKAAQSTVIRCLFLCGLLSGCASGQWTHYEYGPADWLNDNGPDWLGGWESGNGYEQLLNLDIQVHIVDSFTDVCGTHHVGGCAQLDLTVNRCDIYVGERASPEVITHERRYCHGWTHYAIDFRFWELMDLERKRVEVAKARLWYPMVVAPSDSMAFATVD